MSQASSGFRTDINGLRAVAVLCVVLFHLRVAGFEGGFVGVDIFFVISGFLMTGAVLGKLAKGQFSLRDFYWARARRIVPAQLVMLCVLAVAGWFVLLPVDYEAMAEGIVAAVAFVANVHLWRQQGYFDDDSADKWLLHTWSLSVEWQFYLVYPLVLIAIWRLGRNSARWMGRGLVSLAVLSFGLSVWGTPERPEAAFFLLPTRAWEMLVGGLGYCYRDALRAARCRALFLPLGLLGIVASVAAYSDAYPYPGYLAALPVLATFGIIAADQALSVWRIAPIRWLGDTSYSLYLWHWPLIVGARYLSVPLSTAVRGGLIAASLAAAWASYHGVEQVFRRSGQGRSAVYLARWAALSAAVMALGAVVALGAGFPQRLPRLAAENDALRDPHSRLADCDLEEHEHCELGREQARKVLFFGDSHMAQLAPAISSVASEHTELGVVLSVAHGCLPVRGIDALPINARCARFSKRLWARAEQPDVQSVGIASIWSPYFEERLCEWDGRRCRPLAGGDAAMQRVAELLRADIRKLVGLGKRVYMVREVPVYSRDIPKGLALAAWHGLKPPAGKSLAAHHRYVRRGQEVLAAAGSAGATLIDPLPALCSGGQCLVRNERGLSLYSDNNHLTAATASKLVPMLEPMFQ